MTLHEVFAINRFCRADYRLLRRADVVLNRGGKLDEDLVYAARKRVASRYWKHLPAGARKAIKNPADDQ